MHSLIRSKTSGSSSAKNSRVQRFHRGAQIGFGDHEAQIQQRRALRDHADVDAVERIEDAARHSRRVADIVAHQADDGLIVLDLDFGELRAIRRRSRPAFAVLSMVSETLTSEVATISTGVS